MGIFFIGWFAIGPCFDFDESILPPVSLHDLEAFHDSRLAIAHGATCNAIALFKEDLLARWWDQAGCDHEFTQQIEWLKWCYACWNHLEYANKPTCETASRLRWLTILRRLIGPDAYYAGVMPDFPRQALPYLRETAPQPRPVEID